MSDAPTPSDPTTGEPVDGSLTEDEQLSLTMLPSLIGSAVAFSSKSGAVGTVKEMMANAKAAVAGRTDYPDNELIKSLLPNLEDAGAAMEKAKEMRDEQVARLQSAGVTSMEEMKAHTLAQAAEVKELLAGKVDDLEASQYKEWVLNVADSVAKAAKEGGFLGFGGEQVSEEETETIAEVKKALD